jgi:NSS family neurotransmitter:Na+ symporter
MAASGIPSGARWSSKAAFVLAATGSAVGLGNLWRFPTEAGQNGGGAFVLIYVACVVLIAAPLLLSETLIGRHGQRSNISSVLLLAEQSGASKAWSLLAILGMCSGYLILTFYSVVAGWVIYFITITGADTLGAIFSGQPFAGAFAAQTEDQVRAQMPELFADPSRLIAFHAIFTALTTFVVARGVHNGIEKAAVWLMPTFFFLLIGITLYAAVTGDMAAGYAFMFKPDFSEALHPAVFNSALGQAFFSLSLGGGAMVAYGAYASKDTNLGNTTGIVAFADTSVAIIAGLAIFPIVFAVGLAPDAGPTLMFQTLPEAFHSMPAGAAVAFAFFVLVFFAALTSSVSLLEIAVAWASERFGVRRATIATALGVSLFFFGLLPALSFNLLADQRPLGFIPFFADDNWFDALDHLTGRIMMPLAGLITAVFIGWIADKKLVNAETGLSGPMLGLWRFLVAWLCPLAVFLILLFGLYPQLIERLSGLIGA